ncbi:MAG: ABC transporter ATP-binding protein [Clostridium sp.]
MITIEISNVDVIKKGNEILRNVNGNFESGKIYGIFGRNGSGKTMFFRALSGLIKIDSGEIKINNEVLRKDIDFPRSCGILLESAGFWPEYSAYENLKQLSKIKNLIGDEEINKTLELVGLNPKDNKKVRKFSLGMKQKLGIAQAIMEKPDIIILDEPTNGLDDVSIKNVREILKKEKERGALILLASHNKDDINELSDIKLEMVSGSLRVVGDSNDKAN